MNVLTGYMKQECVFSPRSISVLSRRSRLRDVVDRCNGRSSGFLRDGLPPGDHPVSPVMIVRAASEEILKRFTALEEENQRLREETEQFREENKRFRAKLWWHEGAYTPPSKERSADEESRTDGGTPGRKDGHEPERRSTTDPDEEIEVTRDCCPECGGHLDESVGVSPDPSRRSRSHSHQKSPSTVVTLPVRVLRNRDGRDTPRPPRWSVQRAVLNRCKAERFTV